MSSRYSSANYSKPVVSPKKRHQSTSSDSQKTISDAERQEIYEAFTLFDLDNDGFVDYHEMKVAFRALGFELSKSELMTILNTFGETANPSKSRKARVSYDNFYKIAATKVLERDPIDELKRAFALFDLEGKGVITFDDLKAVAEELNEDISDEELHKMIDEFVLINCNTKCFEYFAQDVFF